jgi:hypothetical protein
VVWPWATGWLIEGSSPCRGWEFFSSPPRQDRLWGERLVKGATKEVFFLMELKKLVQRWNRCIEVEGDYVEE